MKERVITSRLFALKFLPCTCFVIKKKKTVLFLNDNVCLLQIENPFYSLPELHRHYLSTLLFLEHRDV